MAPVKKRTTIKFNIIDKIEVIDAYEIKKISLDASKLDGLKKKELNAKLITDAEIFFNKYKRPWIDTLAEIWRWHEHVFKGKEQLAYDELYKNYLDAINSTEQEPIKTIRYEKKILLQQLRDGVSIAEPEWTDIDSINSWHFIDKNSVEKLSLGATFETVSYSTIFEWRIKSEVEWRPSWYEWIFMGNVYEVTGDYTDEQKRLLILEAFDKERVYFEKLKTKYDSGSAESSDAYSRPRIPESVRIEVWRRDGGKCARCGSREKLEYDHIVPISRGGSNTARNIELLCEKHNRSKSNNVV